MSPNCFYAYLAQSLSAGGSETTIYLDRITTKTGETIETSDFVTIGRGVLTINPDGTDEYPPEYASFDAVDGSAISVTGVTRGLSAKSNSVVNANKLYHPVGTPVVISFGTHQLLDIFDYISDAVSGAIGTASTTVAGSTKLSVAPVSPINPIAVGDNDSRVPTANGASFLLGVTGMILPYAGTSAPTGFLLCDGSEVSRTTYAALYAITGNAYGAGNGSTTFNLPDLRSSFPLGGGTARTRTMTFDGASAVDPATDQITVTSNDWLHTGQAVALTGGSLPTGLSATTYYVIRVSATVIKLASSVANANEGTAVDITADGSGTCTLTQTLTARTVGTTGGEESHALTDAEMPSHRHALDDYGSSGGTSYAVADVQSDQSGSNSYIDSAAMQYSGSDSTHNTMPIYTVVSYIIKT